MAERVSLDYADYKLILDVLTEAPNRVAVLSEFEKKFVNESIPRFVKYGRRFVVRGNQMNVYRELAAKLALR